MLAGLLLGRRISGEAVDCSLNELLEEIPIKTKITFAITYIHIF